MLFITLDTSHKKDKDAINSVNPFYLIVQEVDCFIEEKKGSKYLSFALTYINSEVLKNMQKFGVELKIKLKQKIMVNQEIMEKITRK